MKLFISILCVLMVQPVFGQRERENRNHFLRGKVLYMNSGKKPAEGVRISGTTEANEQSNAVYTRSKGEYELKFPNSRIGYPVQLDIGNSDKRGEEIEVVNQKEVEICKIPAKKNELFKIIVCPKGDRDLAAQKYYNIIKTSSDLALADKEKELTVLFNERQKDYKKISALTNELERLQSQTDSVSIYREAFAIASINKDDASERVLRFIQLLEEGKSIQVAREALSIKAASGELDASISQFKAAIEELERRAGASVSIFDYKDAIACYDTIVVKSELMGIDPLLIASYNSTLGIVASEDGNYKKALKCHLKTLDLREKLLKPDHPDLAASYYNIASAHHALGQYKKALEYIQKATMIYEEVSGLNHSDLASSYNNFGIVYHSLGHYEKALEYAQKAIRIQEKEFDLKHPDLAASYNTIAIAHQSLGQYEMAMVFYQKAISILEEVLDPRHPDLATSYYNISSLYENEGKYEKALEYAQKAITLREEVLDSKHPGLADSYGIYARIFNNMGQHEKALEYFQKAISIEEEVLDPMHPKLAGTYNGIAEVYGDLGKYEKAVEYYQKAISIEEAIFEPNHPSLAISYQNVAVVYKTIQQYEKALEYAQKASTIWGVILDSQHPNWAAIFNNIAVLYESMKDYEKSLEYHQKAIVVLKKALDSNHPYIATSHHNIGAVYEAMGQFGKAQEYLEKAIHMREEILDPNHPHLGISYFVLGKALLGLKEYEQAITFTEKSKTIFELSFPEGHRYRKLAVASLLIIHKSAAKYYAHQNTKDVAFDHLRNGVQLGFADLDWLMTNDTMDILRSEPEFDDIIEIINHKKEAQIKPKSGEIVELGLFKITTKTSLRKQAGAAFRVLTRLPVGTALTCLEKTNQYWWKMSYKGKTGFVKAHLLEPAK